MIDRHLLNVFSYSTEISVIPREKASGAVISDSGIEGWGKGKDDNGTGTGPYPETVIHVESLTGLDSAAADADDDDSE